MFQLTKDEAERSNIKYLPYAFTEHGVTDDIYLALSQLALVNKDQDNKPRNKVGFVK